MSFKNKHTKCLRQCMHTYIFKLNNKYKQLTKDCLLAVYQITRETIEQYLSACLDVLQQML